MSPVDPTTFGTSTPMTTDGRAYPEHLRAYHALDDVLLPIVAANAPLTFDDLSVLVPNASLLASLPRWLASAEWRGLVRRLDESMNGPRRYGLGPTGVSRTSAAA